MSDPKQQYKEDEEIKAVVDGFESCETPPAQFDHRAHVTVAFAYIHLRRLTVPETSARMREGLFRFLDHNKVDRRKFNQTITMFWIKFVHGLLDNLDTSRAPADLANHVVEACGDPKLILKYYSRELLDSEEARAGWLEPDIRPLDPRAD